MTSTDATADVNPVDTARILGLLGPEALIRAIDLTLKDLTGTRAEILQLDALIVELGDAIPAVRDHLDDVACDPAFITDEAVPGLAADVADIARSRT
jgi:hypothetical protein